MERMMYLFAMLRSRKSLIQKYGMAFWGRFKKLSKEKLAVILPATPDIGKGIFSASYRFGCVYIALYKAFMELGMQQQEAWENIWLISAKMMKTVPKFLRYQVGKAYYGGFHKKAAAHVERQQRNELHPYDWRIVYREINDNTFEIDITECGIKKLAHDFGADGLLPGICRLDYLLSHLMKNGFERTKTLGDGDNCCNCRYHIVGTCEWSPEKGFEGRK
jgi:hypothetical protein